ncbi:MAG TPA: MBL fold metallo-hydrolase [Chloroflexia bacterium]|nr:MBL fold metallo-hydrolase [Chloroflexia bacterium]
MTNYICKTCGVQYAETTDPPEHCLICEDERQYIGLDGQQWTTLDELRAERHNNVKSEGPGLTYVQTAPPFAIGQCARLIQAPSGNVLWEATSLIDDKTVEAIRELGGISAIAISHPHMYASMVEWSRAFGGVPIYLHSDDRKWVMRPDPAIVHWDGETCSLGEGLTLVRCGGHFKGSTVLHWAAGAEGKGALFTGDTLYVVSDRRYVSFMRSVPNYVPLSARAVQHIVDAVEPFTFDRIYSSWPERVIMADGKSSVRRSAERYIRAINGGYDFA